MEYVIEDSDDSVQGADYVIESSSSPLSCSSCFSSSKSSVSSRFSSETENVLPDDDIKPDEVIYTIYIF